MKPKKRTFADRLGLVNLAVKAQEIPKVREALLKYGYDAKRFEEGEALYEAVRQFELERYCKQGEQIGATDTFRKAFERARRVYADNMKVARVALREDRPGMQKLDLFGKRQKDFILWLPQAKAFYRGALEVPGILGKLSRFSLTKEVIEQGLTLVNEADSAREIRNRLKVDAQKATRERNEALKKAEWWRSDLIAVARVALKGADAQALETLGLTIP